MRPQELRIGNLILLEAVAHLLQFHVVQPQDIADIAYGKITLDSIGPVPLNPRFLEEHTDFVMVQNNILAGDHTSYIALASDFIQGKFVLHAGHDVFWFYSRPFDIRVEHVHQLQNLYFDLVREELKIKL